MEKQNKKGIINKHSTYQYAWDIFKSWASSMRDANSLDICVMSLEQECQ